MLLDIKHALRQVVKAPGIALAIICSLAIGIGLNTTIFSWVSAIMLNPVRGVGNPSELVGVESLLSDGSLISSSYPDFVDFRDQSSKLSGVVAFTDRALAFGQGERVSRVWAELVSGNFFDVLQVKPVVGRLFTGAERGDQPGFSPVVVISSDFWRRQFHSDPSVVGRVVHLNRQPFTIVGVASNPFQGTIPGLNFDLWVPVTLFETLTGSQGALHKRASRGLHLMGRLGPGVGLAEARAEIQTIASRLASAHPDTNRRVGAAVLPLSEIPYGAQSRLGPLLKLLMAAGVVVLLIVCANIINLLLARATVRSRELSIRLALGASRGRLLRQLLTESLLLALVGGLAGVFLADCMKDQFQVFVPTTHLPVRLDFSIDRGVLGYTLAITLGACLLFGLVPAFHALLAARGGGAVLGAAARGASASHRSNRLRNLLVCSEVALALVCLVGAALFLESFRNARRLDPGFRAEGVLLASLNLSEHGYDRDRGLAFIRDLLDELRGMPGVLAAGMAEDVPLGFDGGSWEYVEVDGHIPQPDERTTVTRNLVSPGYFSLMGIPLAAGREFDQRDDRGSRKVAVVNQTFVKHYLPGREPIGATMRTKAGEPITIVGVASDIHYFQLGERPMPYFYLPLEQSYGPQIGLALHVRSSGSAESLIPILRRSLRAVDPSIPLLEVMPLADYIAAAWFTQRMGATLLGSLGLVALVLSTLGIFSVMLYTVAQRTRELGIRLAMGATKRDIFRMVLGQGLRVAGCGVVLGLGLSFALGPLVASHLVGIAPWDPVVLAGATIGLMAVAALAAWVPSARAVRVDPMIALRQE